MAFLILNEVQKQEFYNAKEGLFYVFKTGRNLFEIQ